MRAKRLDRATPLPQSYLSNMLKLFKIRRTDRVSTRPTKEGITFLALSLFVGIAGLNTGNNLLYLIFGMMLSLVGISGFMSMIILHKIDVHYEMPESIFALAPTAFKFFVTNKKSRLPCYSLTVEVERQKGFILYLPAKATKNLNLRCFFRHRGWNKSPEIYLSTSFPFGFFRKRVLKKTVKKDVLVYPKIDKIDAEEQLLKRLSHEKPSVKSGPGSDLRSIRTYQEGDNPKLIHWKSSAKIGQLMIKELHKDESKSAVVEFNPPDDKSRLEIEISRTASLLVELQRRGYEVEFLAPSVSFSSTDIRRSLRPALTYLALYNAGAGDTQ